MIMAIADYIALLSSYAGFCPEAGSPACLKKIPDDRHFNIIAGLYSGNEEVYDSKRLYFLDYRVTWAKLNEEGEGWTWRVGKPVS